MKILFKHLLSAAAAAILGACASFTSGEIKIDREIAMEMLKSQENSPYSDIKVSWENFPYRNGADKIGSGEIDYETGNFKITEEQPEPVAPADLEKLSWLAKKIFKKAKLYDRKNGKGTLELRMETLNRWTYGELINTYMVETPFIMIVPRSLPTVFSLSSDVETSTGTANITLSAINKTYFFPLLAPLYPFFSPSSGEKKILNQILWRMATEVFEIRRKADIELKKNPSLKNKKVSKKEAAFADLEKESKEENNNTESVSEYYEPGAVYEAD